MPPLDLFHPNKQNLQPQTFWACVSMSMVIRVTCEETEPQNLSEEKRAGAKESACHTRPRQEMLIESQQV